MFVLCWHVLRKSSKLLVLATFLCGSICACRAGDLDTIGATLLWQVDSTLHGQSVAVAQVEAPADTNTPPVFEVNPSAVGKPTALFTWFSFLGSANSYPNLVGGESGHADVVADNFYGANGPAPQVSHVHNYEANYFVEAIVMSPIQPSISARVVNQSWTADTNLDSYFDNYAARYGTIFCSGVGNSGSVSAPGTAYNSLGVALYPSSLVGPTPDGRCKPDLVAPDAAQPPYGANSFCLPYASGAAAVLVQAANRGDGGANMTAGSDLRTIKALLLNGAIKPSDWTNSSTRPLDLRYGAGVLNLFNAWNQLKGQSHSFIESTSNGAGSAHPPGTNPNNEPALTGWDLNTINNRSAGSEQVNHYYFLVTNSVTLTATLVWNRQLNQSSVNDLNLFLYNASTGGLINSSASPIDNVEELFMTHLPAGRYDLQVQKSGATQVTAAETYALAFEWFGMPLSIVRSGSNVVISWPLAPTGFNLYSTPSLSAANWTVVNVSPSVSNGRSVVTLPISPGNQFFRLQRP